MRLPWAQEVHPHRRLHFNAADARGEAKRALEKEFALPTQDSLHQHAKCCQAHAVICSFRSMRMLPPARINGARNLLP
jgi:hypothetical protein